MNFRTSVLAAALLCALGCGDGSPADDSGDCTTGSLGCDCDNSGGCDSGSICNLGVCVAEESIRIDSDTDSNTNSTDESPCAVNLCDENASCDDSGGSARCTCNDGWEGEGSSCADIDECARGTYDCALGFRCENTPGAWVCIDLDECALGIHNCATGFQCENIVGAWSCLDIDECSIGTHDCADGYDCLNVPGAWACTDIDECNLDTHDCAAGFICANTVGSFSCLDIDECALSAHDCPAGFICQNTIGSYSCLDINECALSAHDCSANFVCENTIGGWNCNQMACQSNTDCSPGYYCVFDGAANCGLTGTGLCDPYVGACPQVYDPVCDCNGITRPSACAAGLDNPITAAASVDYAGECLSDRCAATGQGWDELACGHYVCGVAPPTCGNPQGGCQCGLHGVWDDTSNSCKIDTDICGQLPTCDDLDGVNFDNCDPTDTNQFAHPLGAGVIGGNCATIFGCEVPPGYSLFANTAECTLECTDCQSNGDCDAGYYCDFPPTSDCGTAGVGTCAPQNVSCPAVWEPVCDCNDVTRANLCAAGLDSGAEAASVQYESVCLWEQEDGCNSGGGTWDPNACGHYNCGVEPAPCADPMGGCDCGSGSNYSESVTMKCEPDPVTCP